MSLLEAYLVEYCGVKWRIILSIYVQILSLYISEYTCVMVQTISFRNRNVNSAHIKHIGQYLSIDIPGNFFICS